MSTYRVLHTRAQCPSCGLVHGWDTPAEFMPVDYDADGEPLFGLVMPPLLFVCPSCEYVAMESDLAEEAVIYSKFETREVVELAEDADITAAPRPKIS